MGNLNPLFESLFESELIEEIKSIGQQKVVKSGEELMDIGNTISQFPLVLDGSLKVLTEDEDGNELLLYYLESGDTCAMTLQCCLNNSKSTIRVRVETDATLIFIPVVKMEEWVVKYKSWRNFVFDSYNERLQEMLKAIDSLAFKNLEERLVNYLKDKVMVSRNEEVKLTHKEIALELNTSRVVISRLMKKLEFQGIIKQAHNHFTVLEF